MGRLQDTLSRSDDRIAVTRTVAPAVWSAVLLFVSDWFGVDIVERVADLSGLDPMDAAVVGQTVVFVALYLVGKFRPGALERILLLVKVAGTSYTQPAGGQAVAAVAVERPLGPGRPPT